MLLTTALLAFASGGCSPSEDVATPDAGGQNQQSIESAQTDDSTSVPEGQAADQDAADQNAADQTSADTVYTNGKIYTVNVDQPWVEAVAIQDGRFVKVGTNEDIRPLIGDATQVIDLEGGFAMPGIGDAHIHPALLMAKRAYCALPGTFEEPTEEQILTTLKQAIADYPEDKSWFIGQGYTTPAMSPETLTREFLDELIPDRPAWIEDETGHNAWFNTKAMEAAGVSRDFEDTPEEFFSRTSDGDLAGVAYEGAMNPFLAVLPPFTTEHRKVAFTRLMDEALSKGITAFGDAYVFEPDLEAYQELKLEEKIHQHVVLYLKGNLGTAELTPVETLEQWWSSYDLPGRRGVKLGMGGALESRSEALIDGYAPESTATVVDSPLPGDHFVFRSFFLLERPLGRVANSDTMEGVTIGPVTPLIFCGNDLSGALDRDATGRDRFPVVPGGYSQRREALKLSINLVLYALTSNYKHDQAHVVELMREGRLE